MARLHAVANCDKPDMGSCGNCCCMVDILVQDTDAESLYNTAKVRTTASFFVACARSSLNVKPG